MRSGTCRAGDADARGLGQQQILAMLARGYPLRQRLLETVVAIRDVLRGPPRVGARDPRSEGSEHIVVERILRGHGPGLILRDCVQLGVDGDAAFAVLETKVGD